MAFGNILKKVKPKVTSSGFSIAEDTVQSIFQTYLQSVSVLDDHKDITELKIGEPVKNNEGVMTRWIDVKTKVNKN